MGNISRIVGRILDRIWIDFVGNGFGLLHIIYGIYMYKNTSKKVDKINIHTLNKDFENKVRLGIMSVLMVNDWINFNDMKSILNITDGNLTNPY